MRELIVKVLKTLIYIPKLIICWMLGVYGYSHWYMTGKKRNPGALAIRRIWGKENKDLAEAMQKYGDIRFFKQLEEGVNQLAKDMADSFDGDAFEILKDSMLNYQGDSGVALEAQSILIDILVKDGALVSKEDLTGLDSFPATIQGHKKDECN